MPTEEEKSKKVMEIFLRIGNHNMTALSARMYGYDCGINPEKMLMHLSTSGYHLGDTRYIFPSLKRIKEDNNSGDKILTAFCYGLITGIAAAREN